MPNTNHRKKSLKSSEARAARNRSERSTMRSAMKTALTTAAETPAESEAQICEAAKRVDKAARHNLVHPNKAARMKSRLMKTRNRAAAK